MADRGCPIRARLAPHLREGNGERGLVTALASSEQPIAMLPVYNAAEVFKAQIKYLDFQNGSGVRFVTMLAQGIMPVTSQEVFYTYQGLTADGAYWISAILPLNAAFLPADDASAGNPPEGGVAFPDPSTATSEQFQSCFAAVTERLNAAAPGDFTPGLDALDEMMQSLQVTAP